MATRSRKPLKQEAVKGPGGFITPNQSMSSGTITPKREDVEISFSDMIEGASNSFKSHDGLTFQDLDEGYATQAQERKLRSDAPSFRTSRQPSPHPESDRLATMNPINPGASLQIVGEKVNLLVDAIEELRQLGLKEIDTELPELVLVGDQSAGKSTLMGAIAEINLPKDKGMCTRCPANIKTAPADTWSCTVSLHEYYGFVNDGRRIITKSQPFPPWKEKSEGLEIKHFKTISNKSELEDVLKWAQVALLNPSQDHKSFIPVTGVYAQKGLPSGHKHEADFSPNIVAIEISGPRLPALSFYDLPGIFVSAASQEEKYLIKVFENLATKYIKHENALVICAITMQNDPGLSRTSAIIEQLKAEKRCVGVLTMPDRLQEGSTHVDYDAILRGRAHILPRGYFVTKQPGPEFQLRQSDYHAQARQEEEAFFGSDFRWSGEWSEFRSRCGTAAIQSYLSQQFANQIAKSMPNIDAKIKAQAKQVDDALSILPELPDRNVQHVVRARLQRFSSGVQRHLEGGPGFNEFLSSWSQLSNDFRDAILTMKPRFAYQHPSDHIIQGREVIDLVDDSDDEPSLPLSRKRPTESPVTPQAQRQKTFHDTAVPFSSRDSATPRPGSTQQSTMRTPKQEGTSVSGTSDSQRRFIQPMRRAARKTVFEPYLGLGKNFMSIGDVRDIISKHKRPGLPGHVDDAAKGEICLQSINPWNLPLETLADNTFKMLREAVFRTLNTCLGDYKQTELYRASRSHVLEFLQVHEAEQRRMLHAFYGLESYKLFTLNNPAFELYKAEELKVLQDARRKRRVSCYVDKKAEVAGKIHTEASKASAEKGVTDVDIGPDPFSEEIQLAAYVRGYYRTAGLRFVDNLCQNIQGNLFKKVHAEILGLLEGALGLNEGDGEKTCRGLMVEDRGEAKQRADLQEKKAKLTQAAESLAELVRKFAEEDASDASDATYSTADDAHDEVDVADGGYNNSNGNGHFSPRSGLGL